jgi:L-alanine-DL-glutamate epimerase-like enolase superfamily enzyme
MMSRKPPVITKVDVTEFEYTLNDMGKEPTISLPVYRKGSTLTTTARIVRVFTDQGVTGEYLGGSATEYSALPMFIGAVLGRSALARESIYNDAKQALRQHARMGMSQVDMALWDLAGKWFEVPVYQLLGEHRRSFPAYASTYCGDREPDGLGSPEAYGDFAEQCLAMGYRAFKIHPWQDAPIDEHVRLVEAVGKRVGGRMDLMLDPFCAILTFADAVKLGRACDAYNYYWYEDPFKDGGVSAFAHRKLRELIKTPILQLEHVRGLEPHVDFIVADGTDFVRVDQDYDGGITGAMKIAHAAEGFGLDVEPHAPGPSRRQCMAATRNSNYYELGLVHPRVRPFHAPVYTCGYSDEMDAIDGNGNVTVPDLPGLGVTFDWRYIEAHKTGRTVYG